MQREMGNGRVTDLMAGWKHIAAVQFGYDGDMTGWGSDDDTKPAETNEQRYVRACPSAKSGLQTFAAYGQYLNTSEMHYSNASLAPLIM